jgi:ribonuclease HII
VSAAAVILPKIDLVRYGLNDSKKMSEKKRYELFDIIKECAIDYGVALVDPKTIDEINILQATQLAFLQAIQSMKQAPDYLLVDGNIYRNKGIDFQCLVKGDSKSASIAAASVLAKVSRDEYMINEAAKSYPEYEFESHKGYATKRHFELIKKFGISPIHRKSFLIKFVERENSLFDNMML